VESTEAVSRTEQGYPDPLAPFTLERVTSPIGAMVSGIDLSEKMADSVFDRLRDALHQYGVLFFSDQHLEPASHIELTSRFGQIYLHPLVMNKSLPEVTILDSGDSETMGPNYWEDKNTGYHTDATFERYPPYVAILRAVMLPSVGGDTMWSSMCAAYEGLSSSMQRLLEGLEAVHDPYATFGAKAGITNRVVESQIHPVIITDPITGRNAIYVNANYTTSIVGFREGESASLLSFLFKHASSPEYQMRYRWSPGSVAMWNERLTHHFGVGDYSERRIMHRVIALGGALA
jgi:taurine dioxygenase